MEREAQERMMKYLPMFEKSAKKWNVPLDLLLSVGYIESRFNPQARSKAGAQGIMQIMPFNLKRMGIPDQLWLDAETIIDAGARYLAEDARAHNFDLNSESGRQLALRAYNAGYGSIKRGYIPRETQQYLINYKQINPEIKKVFASRTFSQEKKNKREPATEIYLWSRTEDREDHFSFTQKAMKLFGVENDLRTLAIEMDQGIHEGGVLLVPSQDGKSWLHSGIVFRGDDDNLYVADSTKKEGIKIRTVYDWLALYPNARGWVKESTKPTTIEGSASGIPTTPQQSLKISEGTPTVKVSEGLKISEGANISTKLLKFPQEKKELPFWTQFYEKLAGTPFFEGGVLGVKALMAERILALSPLLGKESLTEDFWIERGLQPEYWELYPKISHLYKEMGEKEERNALANYLRALSTRTINPSDLESFGLTPQETLAGLIEVAVSTKNPSLISEEMITHPFLADESVISKRKIEDARRDIFEASGGQEYIQARLKERIEKGSKENLAADLLQIAGTSPLISSQERKSFLLRSVMSAIENTTSLETFKDLSSRDFWVSLGLSDFYTLYEKELVRNETRIKQELERSDLANFLRTLRTKTVNPSDLESFGLTPQETLAGLLEVAVSTKNPKLISEEMITHPFLADEAVISKRKIEEARRNIFESSGGQEYIQARLNERVEKGSKENLAADLLQIVGSPLIPSQDRKDFLVRSIMGAIRSTTSLEKFQNLSSKDFWVSLGLSDFYTLYEKELAVNETRIKQGFQRGDIANFLRTLYTKIVKPSDLESFGLTPQETLAGLIEVAVSTKNPHLISEEMIHHPFLVDESVISKKKIEDARRNIFESSGGQEYIQARLNDRVGKGSKENLAADMLQIVGTSPLIPSQERKNFLLRSIMNAIEGTTSLETFQNLSSKDFWVSLGLSDFHTLYENEFAINETRIKQETQRKQAEEERMANLIEAQKAIIGGDVVALSSLRKGLKEEDIEKLGDFLLENIIGDNLSSLNDKNIFKAVIDKLNLFDIPSQKIRDFFLTTDFGNIEDIDQKTELYRLIPENSRTKFVKYSDIFSVNSDLIHSVPRSERKRVLENFSNLEKKSEAVANIKNEPFDNKTLRSFQEGITTFFENGAFFISPYDRETYEKFMNPDSRYIAPLRETWQDAYGVSIFIGLTQEAAIQRANAAVRENFALFYNDRKNDSGWFGIVDQPSIIPARYSGSSYVRAIEDKVSDLTRVAKDEIERTEVVWHYVDGDPTPMFYVIGRTEDGAEFILKDYNGNSIFSVE